MANIKHPTIFNYNSNDNKEKNIDQINNEIGDLIRIRKELRQRQNELLREKRFNNNLERFKEFI